MSLPRRIVILALAAGMAHTTPASPVRQSDLLTSRLLRFWDARGAPIAVIQYSLTSRDRPDPATPRAATFALRQLTDGRELGDTVWQRGFAQSKGKAVGLVASGFITVPFISQTTSWTLTAGPSWLAAPTNADTMTVAPLPFTSIIVSDLAFGVPRTADTLEFSGQRALIDLTRVFERTDSVQLFFQVRSALFHGNARTWITVTNVTDPAHGIRVVQLNYPIHLDAGVNAFERTLGIAKQVRGKYLVELQVGDMAGGGTSVRSGDFVIR